MIRFVMWVAIVVISLFAVGKGCMFLADGMVYLYDEKGSMKLVKATPEKFEKTGEMHEFPAHTVCVAAGTSPNVIYEKEKRLNF